MKKYLFFLTLFSLFSFNFIYSQQNVFFSNDSGSSNLKNYDLNNVPDDEKIKDKDNPVKNESVDFVADPQLAMSVPDYPVTAGDIYSLSFIAGNTLVSYSIPVDSTYKIHVANLGLINVKGLTYVQLKNQVETLVTKNYPLSGVQFVLTSPAVFHVTVTGEASKTTEVKVWALTRLSAVVPLFYTQYSSKRFFSIVDLDGKEKSCDLFKAAREGDFSQDPNLRPGDKIVFKHLDRRVSISGSIERAGSYELKEGENLKELVYYYAAGLDPMADLNRIELFRKISKENANGETIYLTKENIADNFELNCYDSVNISSTEELKPVIFIEGAISVSDGILVQQTNKLTARFTKGEDYAFLLRRIRNSFSDVSDLENAYIIRGEEKIPINISSILYDDYYYYYYYYSKIVIEPYDKLIIPFKQYFVTVAGAVKNPGRYPYIPDRSWDYYVGLAGGFIETQNSGDSVKIVDVNGNKHKKTEPITPETIIEAKSNSFLYFFNQYAPIITTVISAVSTSISILVVSGVID